MLPGGIPLALTSAPMIIAAIAVYAMPDRAARASRMVAIAAVLLTIALLGAGAAPIAAGGRVQAAFGSPLPGISYLLIADPAGMAIALAAAVAALLSLLQPGNPRRGVAGVLLCATGGVSAGMAGNAVMLFGALEVANIGVFALLIARRRRPGRGAMAALFLEHLGALGLLAAAGNLQASTGTSEFSALPGGALTVAVATPWALAGAIRLVTPLLTPVRGAGGLTASWAATAAVPTGAAVLLRLREAAGGGIPAADTVLLAALGALAALGGAALAARRFRVPQLGGRGLCIAAAGPVIALAGFQSRAAATAVAVGLLALELAVMVAPAWERPGSGAASRVAGATAAVAAGGLPIGFGATALLVELTAVVTLGPAATALLVALMLAAVLAAGAATAMAASVLLSPWAAGGSRRVIPVAAAGVGASVLAAVLPGAVAGAAARALAGGGVLASAGFGAVQGPAGGWAGGYFAAAALLLLAGSAAALSIAGVSLPGAWGDRDEQSPVALPLSVGAFRRLRRPVRSLLAAAPAFDSWLAVQPQLPLIAIGAVLAVLLIH